MKTARKTVGYAVRFYMHGKPSGYMPWRDLRAQPLAKPLIMKRSQANALAASVPCNFYGHGRKVVRIVKRAKPAAVYVIRRRFPVEYPTRAAAESKARTFAGGLVEWKVVKRGFQ